ncbi:hypothetical protein AS850_02675 [Frondihabitans sp. 762G35]|uniref:hypothetical protein n=1 Tax=Frondihabitans sp. 762G35 TaxID=1446794 RepID=UPI000D208790|nr:hypothetical protein [Frondihabitans sp. 762G35]ARC55977.1 hypothetical protein AS850_02675 [Frondihabitans sp. 762G35]
MSHARHVVTGEIKEFSDEDFEARDPNWWVHVTDYTPPAETDDPSEPETDDPSEPETDDVEAGNVSKPTETQASGAAAGEIASKAIRRGFVKASADDKTTQGETSPE